MCNYTGHHFGASYEDATCIEGLLWDLDSDDGDGMLTSGGEIPCPACNGKDWLAYAVEDCTTQAGSATEQAYTRINACLAFLEKHHPKPLLNIWMEGVIAPYWEPGDPRLDPSQEICWPWPLPGESAHATLARQQVSPVGFLFEDGFWKRPFSPD